MVYEAQVKDLMHLRLWPYRVRGLPVPEELREQYSGSSKQYRYKINSVRLPILLTNAYAGFDVI